MSWSGWNLPPGCTTRDVDEAMGANEEPDEYPCDWCGNAPDEPCQDDCCITMAIKPCARCLSEPNICTTDEGWQARCSANESGPACTACNYYVRSTGDSYEECVAAWNRDAVQARENQR